MTSLGREFLGVTSSHDAQSLIFPNCISTVQTHTMLSILNKSLSTIAKKLHDLQNDKEKATDFWNATVLAMTFYNFHDNKPFVAVIEDGEQLCAEFAKLSVQVTELAEG